MTSYPAPKHYRATPYLICRNASEALTWYQTAFDAIEIVRLADPSGTVMHAEMRIGLSAFMLADEFPDMGYRSPQTIGGSPVSIMVYVANVDTTFTQALKAGAEEMMPVSDQFDGDRRGTLKDPFGHIWLLASRIEDISIDELKLRFHKMMNHHQ
jgi:PhnB protein